MQLGHYYMEYCWAREASSTLTSTIEIDIPARADIYAYCVGVAERTLWYRVAKPLT